MDDIYAMPPVDPECQAQFVVQRTGILEKKAQNPPCLQGNGMSIDVYAAYDFFGLWMQRRFRAHDADLPACTRQCLRLLPDAPIERNGQILDDN